MAKYISFLFVMLVVACSNQSSVFNSSYSHSLSDTELRNISENTMFSLMCLTSNGSRKTGPSPEEHYVFQNDVFSQNVADAIGMDRMPNVTRYDANLGSKVQTIMSQLPQLPVDLNSAKCRNLVAKFNKRVSELKSTKANPSRLEKEKAEMHQKEQAFYQTAKGKAFLEKQRLTEQQRALEIQQRTLQEQQRAMQEQMLAQQRQMQEAQAMQYLSNSIQQGAANLTNQMNAVTQQLQYQNQQMQMMNQQNMNWGQRSGGTVNCYGWGNITRCNY